MKKLITHSTKHIKIGLLIVFSFIIVHSCTIQQEVVKQYERYTDSVSVLILSPLTIQKSSLVIQRLFPQFPQLSPELQDTVWYHQTKLLDVVADSVILKNYYENLFETFKLSGVKVYLESQIDEFNNLKTPKWVVRVGQFQLEEDKQKVDFSKEISGQEELYKDMEVEVLTINVWLEIFKSLSDSVPVNVLYGKKSISDVVDGRFFSTGDNNQYEFRFKRTDIKKEDVAPLSVDAGKQNAQQLADYFFNKYMRILYPESERYFGYNLKTQSLYYPADEMQLIEMK
jgi:hypothetical protein